MAHANIKTGAEIHTSDGEKLGHVKEVTGGAFKVDAKMKPDYWLACDTVTPEAGGETVRVSFKKDMLGEFKLDETMAASLSDSPR